MKKIKKFKSKFKEKILPKAPAYWIDPIGHILPIFNDEKHIDQILKNPKAFGMSIEEIQNIYNAENETLGSEGKAREKIIKNLIQNGWIRIRYYDRQDTYTINLFRMHKRAKNFLYKWALFMQDLGKKYSEVKIDLPNQVLRYSVNDIANDILFNESIKYNLIVIKSVFDFPDR